MKLKRFCVMMVLGVSLIWGDVIFAKQLEIALFVPRDKGEGFWDSVEAFMQASCNDLDMKLRIYYAGGNRDKMRQQVEEATSGPKKVDAVVFQSFKKGGPKYIKAANDNKTPAFLFNAGVDYSETGAPREQFPYWIGEMLPDDEQAGFDLANVLIDEAKARDVTKGVDGKIQMVGINGVVSDGGAIERGKGLKRAVKNRSDVTLKRLVPGNWNPESGEKLISLMKRYPDVRVAWVANDGMGLGTLDVIKENNYPVLVGGVDWDGVALKAVEQGDYVVSIGGHFMEGGWVAVILYDYLNGIDFKADGLSMKSQMGILTKKNIASYQKHFGSGNWEKIDFKQFSKKHNPQLKNYEFGLEAILKQF